MILINEQWYEVRDLDDIATIIREQFNYDLADRIEELVEEKDNEIKELEDDVEYWSSQYVGQD